MLQPIFYRRGGMPTTNPLREGMRERIVWRLSKGEASRNELAGKFGMSKRDMSSYMADMMKSKMLEIEAGEWFPTPDGKRDRFYRLVRVVGSKARPKPQRQNGRAFSTRAMSCQNEETKMECIAAAKQRAKLIKAGIYSDALEMKTKAGLAATVGLATALLSGCAVTVSEGGKVETAALASACAVSVSANGGYQVACAGSDPAKVAHAIKQIKAAKNG